MVTPGSGGGSRKRTARHLAEALPQPTPPARRHGRSRPAIGACAAAAAPTRSRATARATPTRTARAAIPARSSVAGRGSVVRRSDARLARRYGRLPSSYDWSRTHARRRGGEALERVRDGDWPAASVVTDRFGTSARPGDVVVLLACGSQDLERGNLIAGPQARAASPRGRR